MVVTRVVRFSRRALAVALAVLWASACREVQGPEPGPNDPPEDTPSPAMISNPVTAQAASSSGASFSASAATDVVYVSLSPGSVPDGKRAAFRNRASGAELAATMKDGGFDPVPIQAAAGDTLDFRIELAGLDEPLLAGGGTAQSSASDGVVTFFSVVPPSQPPVVVRTDPPPGKRDVPLNATMLVVFSEPISVETLTASSLQVLRGGVPVAGTFEFVDAANLTVAFTPAEPLAAGTDYALRTTREIEDLDGEPLAFGLTVAFTTLSADLEAVVHVSADPDAPPEGSTVVSSLAEAMTRVAPGGQVLLYGGAYPVENVIVDRPVTIEAAPGTAPLIQAADLGGEVDLRTAFRVEVGSGSVTFRNIAIEVPQGYAAIHADGFDQLAIEGISFTLGRDVWAGVTAGNPATPTALATVRNSTFGGGVAGILATASARVDVFESAFSDHGFAGIQHQVRASGRIEGNTLTECGVHGCIRAVAAERVEIVGNRLATTAGRVAGFQNVSGTVRRAIDVSNGTHESYPPIAFALIENNIVDGLGGPAFTEGAIIVSGPTDVAARGNLIRSAVGGIAVAAGGSMQGSENRLELVGTAWAAHGGTLVDNYSDAVDYEIAVDGTAGVMDVRCNWWGAADGPVNVSGSGDLTVDTTPWATQPVAGTGDRSCTP